MRFGRNGLFGLVHANCAAVRDFLVSAALRKPCPFIYISRASSHIRLPFTPTLPFGTPDEVRQQVRERLETFAPGGGYVFNAIHNVQARTPIANIAAMIDAFHEFR